jgi:hypothetical protein
MKIIDQYTINFENTKIPVQIYSSDAALVNTYEIGILEIGPYTKYIVEKIKEDLLREGIFEKNEGEDFDYEKLMN